MNIIPVKSLIIFEWFLKSKLFQYPVFDPVFLKCNFEEI